VYDVEWGSVVAVVEIVVRPVVPGLRYRRRVESKWR
jgi:hypothetical protein